MKKENTKSFKIFTNTQWY